MGYSSQPGQIGFGIQSGRGVAAAATRFARLRSGSLGGERSLLIPDAEIGGNRDIPGAYLGPVSFQGDLEFYPRAQMLAMLMYGALGLKTSSTSGSATNEAQTLTMTGTPTGGTFQLRFRGQTTATIAFNAAASAVDAALEALGVIDAGEVTCTGGPFPTTPVVVTFSGQYAGENVPTLEVVNEVLTGGTTPGVTVTTSTPGAAVIGTHVLDPGDVCPWLSVEERISSGFESYQYTDAKINSLRIEAEANGYLMGSANVLALTQTSGFTEQADPDWDTTPMMVGSQVFIEFGGLTLPSKSFNLEINNNIENDDFNLGSVFLADATEKRREIKMGLTYRPQDSDLWKAAMYGSTSATTPQAGPAYQGSAKITIATYETIGDIVGGTPFSVVCEIPNLVIAPFKISPSGDDVLQNDLELTIVRPVNAVSPLTVTITNDLPTVS